MSVSPAIQTKLTPRRSASSYREFRVEPESIVTPESLYKSAGLSILCTGLATVLLLASLTTPLFAQWAKSDSTVTAYLFGGIGGFIPMRQSYRINYSTSLGGLPIEVDGGFLFPITANIFAPFSFRYQRREANFIAGTSVSVFSIEPGVRFYLEKQREKDFRIFGGIDALVAQASVMSAYDASPDGNGISAAAAARDYFNLGVGFDIGFAYPLTATTALDGTVHTAVYFGNPLDHGGLGNIGGVSLTAAYRFGF